MKYFLVLLSFVITSVLQAQPEPYVVRIDSTDIFGYTVGIAGDQAMVYKSTFTKNSILAFKRDGSSWVQIDELEAPQGDGSQIFGYALDMQEEYAIVGAPGYTYNGASDAGIAYIFHKNGDNWSSVTPLTPIDIGGHDDFGTDVAIDGDAVIVGSPLDDDRGDDSGSAYIFRNTGAGWVEEAKLGPTDGKGAGHLGRSVAISGDYAIAGVPFELGDIHIVGSAYIFARSDSGWTQAARLEASDPVLAATFGHAVAIQREVAMVGAIGAQGVESTTGAVYVFQKTNGQWAFMQKLIASDGTSSSQFGLSVAFEDNCAVIGANGDGSETGKVYFFGFNGISWEELGFLTAPGTGTELPSSFGSDVALSNGALVVGSTTIDSQSGSIFSSAYLYNNACAAFISTYTEDTLPDRYHETLRASNYPNPFSDQTTISFEIESPVTVTLEVFNSLGQHVTTLASGMHSAGSHQVAWDRQSDDGSRLASGIYFYALKVDGHLIISRPMIVR